MKTEKISTHGLMEESKSLGGLLLGVILGNVAVKMDKKNGMIFPIGLLAAGILGATVFKNSFLKMIALGIGVLGTLKLINKVAAVETTEATNGLLGFKLPESVRNVLQKYVPNLGEGEYVDMSGLAEQENEIAALRENLAERLLQEEQPGTIQVNGLSDDVMKNLAA